MDKDSIIIRDGSEEDLDAFFELYWISSLEHTHYSGILDIPKPKRRCKDHVVNRQRELLKDPHQYFLVAEDNKKVIGMATGHVGERDESAVYSIERIGFIDEICVDKNYRSLGVGKKLLDQLLEKLYSEKIFYVGVGVAFKNPAFHFYKTQDFTPEGMWLVKRKRLKKKSEKQ